LRQASLKALRLDKDVGDLADSDSDRDAPKRGAGKSRAAKPVAPVKISSPTKVVFPGSGYTKQDVADYYEQVMDHFLPGIVDRPLSVIRCPDGAGKACFFQKHHTPGLSRVDLVKLKEEAGN